jgi:hypothetical protein
MPIIEEIISWRAGFASPSFLEVSMEKKYEIDWRDPQQTVLVVTYLADPLLSDILDANLEAFAVIRSTPHDVILLHNGGTHNLETIGIGSFHDLLYNKLPRNPIENLKLIIVLLENDRTRRFTGAAMEILDKLFLRRQMVQSVGSMAEAERLIAKAGF